jgi:uncharacterized protein with PQ loop repeat
MSGVSNSYEWLGLLAGALCVASTVPQLIGNLRQPSKIEVRTVVRNVILATGNLGWVVYGLLNHLISVPLFCGLNVVLLLVLLAQQGRLGRVSVLHLSKKEN